MDADLDVGALEAMGSWIVRVKHKMYGNKEHIVQCILMERVGLVKAVLQSVDMSRNVGVAGQSPLV